MGLYPKLLCRSKTPSSISMTASLNRSKWPVWLLFFDSSTTLGRFKQFPLAGDIVGRKPRDNPVCNLLEPLRRQGQDSGASAGQADTQETRLGGRVHRFKDLGQSRDKGASVRLVDFVLHGQVDHVWVGRGVPQSCRKQGSTL